MIAELVATARVELANKSHERIDLETAARWGARALVAYERYRATGDINWYRDAVEYEHEAMEHASGAPVGTLERVRAELEHEKGLIFR